ncbi:hotdog domain-containing protein [Saccharopolyspora shandongensis]|uniref:acyl-CoA thioesterase n=1 Tax=Saccharopolyspora shandongensis TaxID=418495 RepID=UPI0034101219
MAGSTGTQPAIRYRSRVHFDELDPNGHLHNTRFALHVERATTAAFAAAGYDTETIAGRHPDLHYVVRAFQIEFHVPVTGAGDLTVRLHLAELGRTSATWTFHCGREPNATGTRTIVKVGADGRPQPWSQRLRDWHATLLHGPSSPES